MTTQGKKLSQFGIAITVATISFFYAENRRVLSLAGVFFIAMMYLIDKSISNDATQDALQSSESVKGPIKEPVKAPESKWARIIDICSSCFAGILLIWSLVLPKIVTITGVKSTILVIGAVNFIVWAVSLTQI